MPLLYTIFSISTLTATGSRKTSSAGTSTLCDFRDQLQLGKKLSLHSGKEGSSDLEADPAGDGCDQDHSRSRLRVLGYSYGLPAGKTQNSAWVGLLRRWLCAPATASQPGDPSGGREGFRDRCPLRK